MVAVLDLDGGVPIVYEGDWAAHGPETSWNGERKIVGERGRLLWRGDREGREPAGPAAGLGEEPRPVEQEDLEFVERMATLQTLRETIGGGGWPERPLPIT